MKCSVEKLQAPEISTMHCCKGCHHIWLDDRPAHLIKTTSIAVWSWCLVRGHTFDGALHFLLSEWQLKFRKIMIIELQIVQVDRNIFLFRSAQKLVIEQENFSSFVLMAGKYLVF